jgi:hypothetical protein
VLLATVNLMDKERLLTHVRREKFFARFGEYNEMYLPYDYLCRGLAQTVEAETHVDFSDKMIDAIAHRAQPFLLATESECQAEARGMVQKRRGHVLGANAGGPFCNLDRFLWIIEHEHRQATRRRSNTVRQIIAKYDASGDGLLQIGEFRQMIAAVSPDMQPAAVDQLWQWSGGSGSTGSIDAQTLAAHLFAQEWKSAELHRAESEASPAKREMYSRVAATDSIALAEMAAVSKLWDEVKDGAERVAAIEHYLGNWHIVVRLQAWARGSMVRNRVNRSK